MCGWRLPRGPGQQPLVLGPSGVENVEVIELLWNDPLKPAQISLDANRTRYGARPAKPGSTPAVARSLYEPGTESALANAQAVDQSGHAPGTREVADNNDYRGSVRQFSESSERLENVERRVTDEEVGMIHGSISVAHGCVKW